MREAGRCDVGGVLAEETEAHCQSEAGDDRLLRPCRGDKADDDSAERGARRRTPHGLRKLETAITKLATAQGELPDCHASTDRVAFVTEGEYSYPIPRIRSRSAFTRVRKLQKEP
jgi:hypothetical protein